MIAKRVPRMRMAAGSMLKAAALVNEGHKVDTVAAMFERPPGVAEVKRWAADLKDLDRTGFLARYGAKSGARKRARGGADPRVLIANTLVELKAEREVLIQRACKLEEQINSYSAALEALDKHVTK